MRCLFIADAHLRDPHESHYQKLLRLLQTLDDDPGEVFFMGDTFDFWMGYRYTVFAPYVPFLERLRQLREREIAITLLEGNHDFLLGPYFNELGCTVLPANTMLVRQGKKLLLAHGDLIDEGDVSYRRLRALLRHPLFYAAFRIFPPDWAWRIAEKAAEQSKKKRETKGWIRRDPRPLLREHARRYFAQDAEAVITGHFHFSWREDTEEGVILSLGDWRKQSTYAVLENGLLKVETMA